MVDIFWNYQGVRGYRILVKMENLKGWGGGGGGSYMKFPLWWEYGYFLELHNTVDYTFWPIFILILQTTVCIFA